MTVKELKQWLERFPDTMELEVTDTDGHWIDTDLHMFRVVEEGPE